MCEYDISINLRINAHYMNEICILKDLHLPYQPDKVFWIWIAELLTECFNPERSIPAMNDFMGMIMDKIKGDNHGCTEILNIVEENDSEYMRYTEDFKISKAINKCGRYYVRAYDENDEILMERLVTVLSDYVNVIAPYGFEEFVKMTTCIVPRIFDDKKIDEARKIFRGYIAKYKGLIKEFQA